MSRSLRHTCLLLLLCGVILPSCEKEHRDSGKEDGRVVAIVAPGSDRDRLEQTATWFMKAQSCKFKLEWFDEEKENLTSLGQTLSKREDVLAVIGPFDNERMVDLAQECKRTLKPVIAPTASSEEVVRRFGMQTAGNNKNLNHFFWALTSTDVSLTELLLSHYGVYQEEHEEYTRLAWPAFFAPDDLYGQTFSDWAPFYAGLQDFPIKQYDVYRDQDQLLKLLREQMDFVSDQGLWMHLGGFCVLESSEQLLAAARERRRWMLSDPELQNWYHFPSQDPEDRANDAFQPAFLDHFRFWFSLPDILDSELAAMGDAVHLLEGYQFLSPCADPDTDFARDFEKEFGRRPGFAEAKLCDALLLIEAAVSDMDAFDGWNESTPVNERLNESIAAVTPLKAATGELSFDDNTGMPTTRTTYAMWEIENGKLSPLHYYYDGATEVMKDWKEFYDQRHASEDFDAQAGGSQDGEFAPLTGRYAVLVQGSHTFDNYRHAADVLGIYQLLLSHGMDDDHIILILDKQIATDPSNPSPGEIHMNVVDPDLYGGKEGLPAAVVDYDAADLTPLDIAEILQGHKSDRLPVVLPEGEGNNILLYWSGHGRKAAAQQDAEFAWRGNPAGSGFTSSMLLESVRAMTFRKMLVIAEPCYSEAVLTSLNEELHVLGLSGASKDEQSWADCWDYDYNFWMCDRFTRNVITILEENPSASYRDIFLYCSANTLGSHPRIIPGRAFGNLYVSGPQEFMNNP